jgi:NMD protein affecting ribosome stability and mRNA decay
MKEQHNADYFEGTLQLRDVDQQVYDWVYDTIERDGKARVAKEKILKNGYDLYLSDQHYLQALGRKLKIKFPGELEVSERLHSRDPMTQKARYRVTVLFRALPVHVGDILRTDHGTYRILHVGRNVRIQDLASGRKDVMPLDQAKKWVR